MSYVHKRTRIFRSAGDVGVYSNCGRLKSYASAIDARTWCNVREERRQYILEIVSHGGDGKNLSLGKYIPIEAIINILLANKDAEIAELKKFIESQGLHYEEKEKSVTDIEPVNLTNFEDVKKVKRSVESEPEEEIQETLAPGEEPVKEPTTETMPLPEKMIEESEKTASLSDEESINEPTAPIEPLPGKMSEESDKTTPLSGEEPTALKEPVPEKMIEESRDTKPLESMKEPTEVKEPLPGTTIEKSEETKSLSGEESIKEPTELKEPLPGTTMEESGETKPLPEIENNSSTGTNSETESVIDETSGSSTFPETGETETSEVAKSHSVKINPQTSTRERETESVASSVDIGEIIIPVVMKMSQKIIKTVLSKDTIASSIAPEETSSVAAEEPETAIEEPKPSKSEDKQLLDDEKKCETSKHNIKRELESTIRASLQAFVASQGAISLAGISQEDQIKKLKDELTKSIFASFEIYLEEQHSVAVEAIEELESIKSIVHGPESIQSPPLRTFFTYGKRRRSSDASNSSLEEIENLEHELYKLKDISSSQAEIAPIEIELLKKYCSRLSAIHQENVRLKKERDALNSGRQTFINESVMQENLTKMLELSEEKKELEEKVQELEEELERFGNLPEEIKELWKASQFLDEVIINSPCLKKRLAELKGLEDDIKALKQRNEELGKQKGDVGESEKLKKKITLMIKEIQYLKDRSKEAEKLKIERDCLEKRIETMELAYRDFDFYRAKYQSFQTLDAECEDLRSKVEKLNQLETEREMLMKKIQNCECCINKQESDIKKLLCHIECMQQDSDKKEPKLKCKVVTMKAHLPKKEADIVKSEEKLTSVQDPLQTPSDDLSCEKNCMRHYIEQLEALVKNLQSQIEQLKTEIKQLENSNKEYKAALDAKQSENEEYERTLKEKEELVKKYEQKVEEYRTAFVEKEISDKILSEKLEEEKSNMENTKEASIQTVQYDDHVQKMLKQTKCALECIGKTLGRYGITDIVKLEREKQEFLKRIYELELGVVAPCGTNRVTELEEELKKAKEAGYTSGR